MRNRIRTLLHQLLYAWFVWVDDTASDLGLHTCTKEQTGKVFNTYMEKVKEDLLANSTSKSAEELWTSFKSSVNEGLIRFVPCKKDWFKEKSSLDHPGN